VGLKSLEQDVRLVLGVELAAAQNLEMHGLDQALVEHQPSLGGGPFPCDCSGVL
jgi:hypothetical protein